MPRIKDPNQPPRKRGAPYGNTNALVHGYYARSLRLSSAGPDSPLTRSSLGDEIAFLRAFLARVVSLSTTGASISLETQLSLLRAFSAASNTMARLVQCQRILQSSHDPRNADLLAAVQEMIASQSGSSVIDPDP